MERIFFCPDTQPPSLLVNKVFLIEQLPDSILFETIETMEKFVIKDKNEVFSNLAGSQSLIFVQFYENHCK